MQIFDAPTHPYTQGLLECIPIPGKTERGAHLGSIPGIVPSLVGEIAGCHFASRCRYATEACHRQTVSMRDALADGHAYLHLGNNRLTCLDLEAGEDRWTSRPFGKYWSKAVQGDKIVALDESGELHLVRASPEKLEILDSRQVSDSETWGHLAVAGDEIFVRELEAVAAYRWCRGGGAPMAAIIPPTDSRGISTFWPATRRFIPMRAPGRPFCMTTLQVKMPTP